MATDPHTVKAVFLAAVEKTTPEERAAYLEEVCGNDAALRRRVEALLRVHDRPGSFLERPAVGRIVPSNGMLGESGPVARALGSSPAAARKTAAPGPGDGPDLGFLQPAQRPDSLGRLDHYEVLQVVGQGSMGV